MTTYIQQAQDHLRKGRIQDSINVLKENVNDEGIVNQMLQLEIRYNSLTRRVNSGTIDPNDAQLEENRISNSILFITSNLAKGKRGYATAATGKPEKSKEFDFKWAVIGFLGLALVALAAYFALRGDAGDAHPCDRIECLNGGVCHDGTCDCPTGYTGRSCQTKEEIAEVGIPATGEDPPTNPGTTAEPSTPPPAPDEPAGDPAPPPAAAGKPDIQLTALQWKPTTPVQGERMSLQAVVKNTGAGDAGRFTVQWWAGENFPEPAYERVINGLKAEEQEVLNFTYAGYRSWYGRITTKFVVDAGNDLTELNESNNISIETYAVSKKAVDQPEITAIPDLMISAFQMNPTSPVKGKKINLQAIIKNTGGADAGPFTVQWWAGENYPKPAYEKKISGLRAGAQQVLSFSYTGYPSWYGRITAKMLVDSGNTVAESNERNNELKKTYAVKR
ncbi:MAG: CARDB domain-containing protein [Saprospiraceae bacterium]